MSDKDKRRLVFSIVQFLNSELGSDHISEDAKEGLEVASQCLQTAYCMAPEDTHLEVSRPLFDIFLDATKNEPVSSILGQFRLQEIHTYIFKGEGGLNTYRHKDLIIVSII
jgi:hypothetical protein